MTRYLSVFCLVLLLCASNARAYEQWHCSKKGQIIKVAMVPLQADILLPCEVRLEEHGITKRAYHENVDVQRCHEHAQALLHKYQQRGWHCESADASEGP